jgi:hypothetical protein
MEFKNFCIWRIFGGQSCNYKGWLTARMRHMTQQQFCLLETHVVSALFICLKPWSFIIFRIFLLSPSTSKDGACVLRARQLICYSYTLRMRNNYCVSTVTVITRKHLNISFITSCMSLLIFMYGIPLFSVNASKLKTPPNQLQFTGNNDLFSVCYYSLPWWTIIRLCLKFKNV